MPHKQKHFTEIKKLLICIPIYNRKETAMNRPTNKKEAIVRQNPMSTSES